MTARKASALLKTAVFSAGVALLLGACASSNGPITTPDESAPSGKTADKISQQVYSPEETAAMKKAADAYLNDILTGLKDRNYKLYVKHFTDEIKIEITDKAFQVMVDQFNSKKGPYITRQYLGDMTQGYFKIFLWRAQFEQPKELVELAKKRGKDPKTLIQSDTLVRLEMAKIGDEYIVMGIYFQ